MSNTLKVPLLEFCLGFFIFDNSLFSVYCAATFSTERPSGELS